MRNWSWIKVVALDALSSPFFGSIGFCRTEALGVRGRRGGMIFLFFVLPRRAQVRESSLCCLWKAARSQDRTCSPGSKTLLRGTSRPRFSCAAGVALWGHTTYALSYVSVQGPSWCTGLPYTLGSDVELAPGQQGTFLRWWRYLWEFHVF